MALHLSRALSPPHGPENCRPQHTPTTTTSNSEETTTVLGPRGPLATRGHCSLNAQGSRKTRSLGHKAKGERDREGRGLGWGKERLRAAEAAGT